MYCGALAMILDQAFNIYFIYYHNGLKMYLSYPLSHLCLYTESLLR